MSAGEKENRQVLHDAIKEYLEATVEGSGVLTGWVLVTAETNVYEDGASGTSLSVITEEHQGIHITAGLLKYATVRNEYHMDTMQRDD